MKQNELSIKKAELKKTADIKIAEAEAAKSIESKNQRREHEIATANANIARQEKEIEIKEREVQITERQLEADIKKKSEAEKYEAEQKAEAQKALAFAIQVEGEAKAAAKTAEGKAEATAIQAKLEAEAKGLREKAEAMKEYGEAARQQMELDTLKVYFEQLPDIAKAIGDGYQNVEKIVMLGGDSSKLAGDIITNVTQISEGMSQSLGIDLKSLLAGIIGGKLAGGNPVSPINMTIDPNFGKGAATREINFPNVEE